MCDWENINDEERVKLYTNMENGSQIKNIKLPRQLFLSNENKSDRNDVPFVINIGYHLLGSYIPTAPDYWKMQNNWEILGKYENKNALLVWGDIKYAVFIKSKIFK